jgi:hypothetical protein
MQCARPEVNRSALDGAPPAQEIEYFLALFRAGKLDEAQVKGAMLLRDYPPIRAVA